LNEKNRFILLTSLLTFLSALLFNNIYASDFLIDTAKNLVDTTSVHFSDLYQSNHFFELATLLPFHNEYLVWDTIVVHPYHFDMAHMRDTVQLVLTHDGSSMAFVAPIAGALTSNFGQRTHTRYHYGVDLKLNVGDSVRSAFDGVVRISQYNHGGYGNVVVIRHYNGLETIYGHLSGRAVVPGQIVRAGDLIGFGGNTGHSTGPHLHFETRYKGQAIDPRNIIDFYDSTGYSLKSDTLTISNESFEYYTKFKTQAHYYKSKSVSRIYTIRRGDTLSEIAVKHNTTINRLCQLNRISRSSKLRPGQKLKVK
jgi:hypothetical protein